MVSATYEERVGTIILDQLAHAPTGAGENRLRVMVKATEIVTLIAHPDTDLAGEVFARSPGVGFRFRGSKDWNGIEIYLDLASDTYTLRFYRRQPENRFGTVLTTGEWMHDVYAEDLGRIFRDETGLDTHL